ncbi:MAG: CinA family nicotinamide mononucleotide deamidase-related protein [Acidobacteriota bacterium]
MKAAILAVGSELLGTDRLDTNSLRLTQVLEAFGVELATKAVVGDDRAALGAEIRRLAAVHGLLLITGGLGPTADDLTREATADAFDRELALDDDIVAGLRRRFREYGLEMPAVNQRQGFVVAGAEVLANGRGTAPGQRLEADGTAVFLFPGVPVELEAMIGDHLEPWLRSRGLDQVLETAALKVACLPESTVEERIAPAYEEFGRETLSVLAKPGEVRLQFHALGREGERQRRLATIARRLRELVGPAVFTDDGDQTLEGTVGELLRQRGRTVVTAESCTGGLIAERLTATAGSSAYFLGGAVTYSNQLKTAQLGVAEDLLAAHGAVSEAVARAMAAGALSRLGGDYALAVTGVAGPGGGSEEKPVGTVHLACAGPEGVDHRRVRLAGDRGRVRWLTSQIALEMLRRRLLP